MGTGCASLSHPEDGQRGAPAAAQRPGARGSPSRVGARARGGGPGRSRALFPPPPGRGRRYAALAPAPDLFRASARSSSQMVIGAAMNQVE